ncbi:MAG: hypothetical protein QXT77_09485 [Candidatus Methanomethylicaceae archaeon]
MEGENSPSNEAENGGQSDASDRNEEQGFSDDTGSAGGKRPAVWKDVRWNVQVVRTGLTMAGYVILLLAITVGIGYTQREDVTPPRIWTNIQSGDIYLTWAPPVILVNVTDDTDPNPSVEILLNGEPYFSGAPVEQSGIYHLKIRALDSAGNQAHVSRYFQVDDYITLVGNASVIYWYRNGQIVEAIVVQRLRDLHVDPRTKGVIPQVAMCEYVPTSLTLRDRWGRPVGDLKRFWVSPYIENGYTEICCEMVTPIVAGIPEVQEAVVAHFRGEISEGVEITYVEMEGLGEDISGRAVVSISQAVRLASMEGWKAIVEEQSRRGRRCKGRGGGDGGGGNNRPCSLPRARLRKTLLERCDSTCQQIDNVPYSCLPCFTSNGFYCSGHFISCVGAECDGFAEARDNSRPCHASTIGNADDYITLEVKMHIDDAGTCPCNYHMRVETRPKVRSKGYISWGGDGTLALSAGAVIVSVTGACALQCQVADAVGVGSIEGTEVNLGISRGQGGGSGSISIPIRIGQGREYNETIHNHCACEGPGQRVTVGVSSAARVQATANGPIGALITVSAMAEVSTSSNTSVWGIIRCDADSNPGNGKEMEIILGPVRIP